MITHDEALELVGELAFNVTRDLKHPTIEMLREYIRHQRSLSAARSQGRAEQVAEIERLRKALAVLDWHLENHGFPVDGPMRMVAGHSELCDLDAALERTKP